VITGTDHTSRPTRARTSVLQVGKIESSLADTLKAKHQALQLPNDSTRSAFLAEHGPSVTAIVDSGPPGVDADLMNALPNLGAIVHVGDGYDTIDVDAARTLGVGVSDTPEVLNDTVADAAVGLMLATMRGLCAADRYVRAGLWPQGARYPLGETSADHESVSWALAALARQSPRGWPALVVPSRITIATRWRTLPTVMPPRRLNSPGRLTCSWRVRHDGVGVAESRPVPHTRDTHHARGASEWAPAQRDY
jgi:hypothetical protein